MLKLVNAQLVSVRDMVTLEERFACRLEWSECDRMKCLTHPQRGVCRWMLLGYDTQQEHRDACHSIIHMHRVRRHLRNIKAKLIDIVSKFLLDNVHLTFTIQPNKCPCNVATINIYLKK